MASTTRKLFSFFRQIPMFAACGVLVVACEPVSSWGQQISGSIQEERERYFASIYPADVMNCDVCRTRLGLPPLASSSATQTNQSNLVLDVSQHAATLPRPVVRPLSTLSQKMSTPAAPTRLPLDGSPPSPSMDVSKMTLIERQQLLNAINVPAGERVLSFRIIDPPKPGSTSPASVASPEVAPPTLAPEPVGSPSLPAEPDKPK
jgi:hypothetical protein